MNAGEYVRRKRLYGNFNIKPYKTDEKPLWFYFMCGIVIGACIFIYMYGPGILNVQNDGWILDGWCDLRQHYLGWVLYRKSEWNFPFGLCSNSFYPNYQSVVYTDSVPLVSFLFKLLSPLLPDTFQFFGIYGLFCFAMQGGFAELILARLLRKQRHIHAGTLMFVFSASMIQRMYYHTALASHYLILAGIALYIYRDKIMGIKKRILLWCILGMCCVSVHITIYGMVSVMLFGFALLEALYCLPDKKKMLLCFTAVIGSYLAASVFTLYLFGGFNGKINETDGGLGYYSANINALFNPDGYSTLIQTLPHNDGQYEGLSYIGIAAIILLIIAVPNIIHRFNYIKADKKYELYAYLITVCLLCFIAYSPKVTLGEWTVLEEKWPQWILDLWGMFRSSGRFMWPVAYATMFIALHFAFCELKNSFGTVLAIAVCLQLYEYGDQVRTQQETYYPEKEPHFSAELLEDYEGFSGMKHIQFMYPYDFYSFYMDQTYQDQMVGYTRYALSHDMTVSNFHFSREDRESLEKQIDVSWEELKSGRIRKDTVYVFDRRDFEENGYGSMIEDADYLYTEEEVIAYTKK